MTATSIVVFIKLYVRLKTSIKPADESSNAKSEQTTEIVSIVFPERKGLSKRNISCANKKNTGNISSKATNVYLYLLHR